MLNTLSMLPVPFWLLLGVLGWGLAYGLREMSTGIGLPIIVVLLTVAAWYVGDAFYNDYAANHARLFSTEVLSAAWWQVLWFSAVFLAMAPVLHQWLNHRWLGRRCYSVHLYQAGVDDPALQKQLGSLFRICAWLWAGLLISAWVRLRSEVVYYFFPFLSYRADPWARGRIGGGIDFLLVLGSYLDLLVAACFGIVSSLSTNRGVRFRALAGCAVTWPYIFLNGTRNYMLTAAVPGVLSWVLLKLRVKLPTKIALLAVSFLMISLWFSFVIANRSVMSLVDAARQGSVLSEQAKAARHEGLNMLEELCWINSFIDEGIYQPNRGERYFAELVNPIPRTLWKKKPTIGLDYAVARGQGGRDIGQGDDAGVYATISTGMIGQGVVNFGKWLGPAFAALLMALWAAVLARFDLRGDQFGRIPLFGVGLILTFNLGRDITLLTLYPFVFGTILVWLAQRVQLAPAPAEPPTEPPGRPELAWARGRRRRLRRGAGMLEKVE